MFASENGLRGDPRLKAITEAIRVVPHFPKRGIMFQDITTLLLDHKAFKGTVDIFVDRYRDMGISVVAGVEARGFMFGPSIALAIGAKFVPLRKPKKLPGEVISEDYELEYGTDCLEMHLGAVQPGERVLVIDDLVATGGTLSAAIRLLGTERPEWNTTICPCGASPVDNLSGSSARRAKMEQFIVWMVDVCLQPSSFIPGMRCMA
ncbi:adenine phosphoribosyltransferase 5-like isoform X1 [Camellia sinensis]|uniref:adenine phosphoribosyltransferase 5-like isoform X1 n=1 Tax=Camellia sinensis TaxID=4442 RepID=UPI0010357DFA|nr:adenine phosphoribosyltransferase 5-like isoform X1 [Camellia sinensis]